MNRNLEFPQTSEVIPPIMCSCSNVTLNVFQFCHYDDHAPRGQKLPYSPNFTTDRGRDFERPSTLNVLGKEGMNINDLKRDVGNIPFIIINGSTYMIGSAVCGLAPQEDGFCVILAGGISSEGNRRVASPESSAVFTFRDEQLAVTFFNFFQNVKATHPILFDHERRRQAETTKRNANAVYFALKAVMSPHGFAQVDNNIVNLLEITKLDLRKK